MKVLVINWRDLKNPEAGGAEIHIDEILKRKPADWHVDFVSASFKGSTPVEEMNGYTVYRFPNNALFNFTFYYYWNKILKKNNYDLVIDDISKIPLATPLFIKNCPILAIQHHIHGKSLFKQLSYPMAFYVYQMEKFLLRFYTKTPLVAVSESTKNELVQKYSFQKIVVSHNGIDFDSLKGAYRKDALKAPILLYFGRLKKYKRVDHCIEVLKIVKNTLPEARLWVAGKGDDEMRLKNLVQEENLTESVDFLGFVSEADKSRLFSEAFLFLLPSEKEGWGISVIEANAGGLPAIGYNIEGLRDSIKQGETGYLIENGNAALMAEAVLDLWKDTNRYKKLSESAYQWASGFSWDNMAKSFYNIALKTVQDFTRS